jgi:diketogulonate reductase-like aldo/keto reductase
MKVVCRPLGAGGTEIPEVGLGTHRYRGGPAPLRAGIEAGAFIDTAESYGTESVVGEAVRGVRARVFIATKVSPQHFRRADVLAAADRSLRTLGTDYIDLYQLHEPNDRIPIAETLAAMEDLVDTGKVRFIGVSNFSLEKLREAEACMRRHRIVANQIRYNIADRTLDGPLFAHCADRGIVVIAYSPLARGLSVVMDCDASGALRDIARETGKTCAQVALNWCLCQEPVVVIPKSDSTERTLENCGASGWRLTVEQLRRLDNDFAFRRRGGLEDVLRRWFPPRLKRAVRDTVQHLPAGVRRRIN